MVVGIPIPRCACWLRAWCYMCGIYLSSHAARVSCNDKHCRWWNRKRWDHSTEGCHFESWRAKFRMSWSLANMAWSAGPAANQKPRGWAKSVGGRREGSMAMLWNWNAVKGCIVNGTWLDYMQKTNSVGYKFMVWSQPLTYLFMGSSPCVPKPCS